MDYFGLFNILLKVKKENVFICEPGEKIGTKIVYSLQGKYFLQCIYV